MRKYENPLRLTYSFFVYGCLSEITYVLLPLYNCTCTFKNIHIHAETTLTVNDDFNNERIHFFIKIYLSHFILERVKFVYWRLGRGSIYNTYFRFFFPVICWSYLWTEISAILSIHNKLYSSPYSFIFSYLCPTLLLLSCDRIESAKLIVTR